MSSCRNTETSPVNQFVVATLLLWAVAAPLVADDLPPGVVDTQQASDIPLSPAESQARITVPEGFQVTLFAGEPDIRRPIAFDFDDRGRLWVVENYSPRVAARWGYRPDCDPRRHQSRRPIRSTKSILGWWPLSDGNRAGSRRRVDCQFARVGVPTRSKSR